MEVERKSSVLGHGMGWVPDYPDFRDFTIETEKVPSRLKAQGRDTTVKQLVEKVGVAQVQEAKLPNVWDLRRWCPPIEDQKQLGSCTANAGVALIEYFERKAFGKHIDASRLFLYKATRNLLKWTGDSGATLRSTMEAMVLFGIPPEEYWGYDISSFDQEPPAFCYAFASNYKTLQYLRLDPPSLSKPHILNHIKAFIAAGLPSMFGFTVFSSIQNASTTGQIPFPAPGERVLGGHAIVAVGFNDDFVVKTGDFSGETKGALLIRNSWGTGWGDKGYGWLPYDYVLKGLAEDWWTLIKGEWVDTGQFKL